MAEIALFAADKSILTRFGGLLIIRRVVNFGKLGENGEAS
jgi:uncharacterized membrane protein